MAFKLAAIVSHSQAPLSSVPFAWPAKPSEVGSGSEGREPDERTEEEEGET